jgi:SpoIID/LytB domain protein
MALRMGNYDVCVNPFPIFPGHLTIISRRHTEQMLNDNVDDLVNFAVELEGETVFYNGAHCGASAPDHLHFQAVGEEWLTLCRKYPFRSHYFVGSRAEVTESIKELLDKLPVEEGHSEPRVNVAVHVTNDGEVEAVVVPRRAHRPKCYDTLHVSPGAIDMLGRVVTVSEEDFNAVSGDKLSEIFDDVAYLMKVPELRVGIMTGKDIDYSLDGEFEQQGDMFRPMTANSRFTLNGVTIGVGFHWEKKERQTFSGALQLLKHDDEVTAVNVLPVEDYLMSVISSEMSAEASLELLKAHAVISRSWVMAQLRHKEHTSVGGQRSDDDEVVKWYDHDDHTLFDVCADDHCQRYQGVTRVTREDVRRAVAATCGEVLMADGELCDARFSKCCGGAFEEFEHCWEDEHHSYLEAGRDLDDYAPLPDLSREDAAREWILGRPEAFCSDVPRDVLAQVLNDYDLATKDFYRWEVSYSDEELAEILHERSGIDFGRVTALEPLSRGTSGRIDRLRIVGTKRTMIVGKELEIRRWLSRSHLYSSAFVAERTDSGFTLHGAGWGHGVGLCQIGAAVMGARGYNYKQILKHYFRNAEIERLY